MDHTFQIRYQCDHQHTFTTPRLRSGDRFPELAANRYAVSVSKVCPHCELCKHPDLNKRLAYIRRTLNPCRGTEYHRLDCGHYVHCEGLLGCVDNCELGYLWMPHVNGSLGCRKCIVTYFQARVEVEFDDMLRRVRSSLEFRGLRHLSDAEFVDAVGETFAQRYLRPLEAALIHFQTEVFESFSDCDPADTDMLYKEIEMDGMMADMDIAAGTAAQMRETSESSDLFFRDTPVCDSAAALQSAAQLMKCQELNDGEPDKEDPIEQFWQRTNQTGEDFDQQAARILKNHWFHEAEREEIGLLRGMIGLELCA